MPPYAHTIAAARRAPEPAAVVLDEHAVAVVGGARAYPPGERRCCDQDEISRDERGDWLAGRGLPVEAQAFLVAGEARVNRRRGGGVDA